MVERNYDFQQKLANESKLGAYYTDVEHCRSLSGFFKFGKSTLVLEPSIGNGVAVKTVIDKQADDGKLIFGVELNEDTYHSIENDPELEVVLNADFLHGIRSTNNQFTFCFSNPPYGDGERNADGKTRRLETQFLERIFALMRKDGVLCIVIPEYVLRSEEFMKSAIGRFTPCHVFRFREPEYIKFKQCVFIGKAKKSIGWMKQELEDFKKMVEFMPELPKKWNGERIEVPDSYPESIQIFSQAEFNPDMFITGINSSRLRQVTKQQIIQKRFGVDDVHPPIQLKDNLLYLLAVSGEGQGKIGDESAGTLHLQRGVVKLVDNSSFVEDEDTGKMVEVVTTSPQVQMNIIEADGTILKLK